MIIKLIISFILAVLMLVACVSIPVGINGGFEHEILNDICVFLMFAVPIIIILGFLTCIIFGTLFCQ